MKASIHWFMGCILKRRNGKIVNPDFVSLVLSFLTILIMAIFIVIIILIIIIIITILIMAIAIVILILLLVVILIAIIQVILLVTLRYIPHLSKWLSLIQQFSKKSNCQDQFHYTLGNIDRIVGISSQHQ